MKPKWPIKSRKAHVRTLDALFFYEKLKVLILGSQWEDLRLLSSEVNGCRREM